MRAVVEPLEGNKVKLSVEIDEDEFEKALEAAFRKIAREVRIPGFRPGKAPRRLLEARIGTETARQEALRDSLPDYYAWALKETDVDPIAPPEIDITSGQEEGPVSFDVVVEVRPQVSIAGYRGLRITVPSPAVSDEDIDRQIDRLRQQTGELAAVSRSAREGDFVSIDWSASQGEERLSGAEDELYEVGSGMISPDLDEKLRGGRVGDILTFTAPAGEGITASYRVLVKDVKEKILPELNDEWASEASEFDTLAELRADLDQRLSMVKRVQSALAMRDESLDALVELVADDPPDSLVGQEMERRLHDLAHRLEAQGATVAQYLEASGASQDDLIAQLRAESTRAVKADLALRALADAEGLEASDDDLEAEILRLAERLDQKPAQLRRRLEQQDALPTVRSDVRKSKAWEWLVEHVEIVDEEGRPVDRAVLMPSTESTDDRTEEVN